VWPEAEGDVTAGIGKNEWAGDGYKVEEEQEGEETQRETENQSERGAVEHAPNGGSEGQ
jgi:hypothetical protein